jgi:chromosome partitioning protein
MAAETWAITAQKGGVSKTTTSVNLAAALASLGKRVLLCDLDPQANATVHLGIDPVSRAGRSMYELITKKIPAREATFVSARANLDLIPGHLCLAAAELEIAGHIGRERNLASRLQEMRGEYDYILIDCPPGVGLLVANAYAASEQVLLVAQPEFFALYGLTLFTQLLADVRESCNPSLRVGGVLISMIDPKQRGQLAIHRESAKDIGSTFEALVFKTRIRLNARLKEAPSFGKTIFEHAPKSSGAVDYMNLAKEMCDHAAGREREEDRPGVESAA